MLSIGFKSLLEGLDLLSNEAVFFRNEKNGFGFMSFTTDIQKKLDIISPDAYFVFNSQPYVLFFDLTGEIDNHREAEIHKQVWSFDYSPVIFIIKDSDIQIFNAFSFEKNQRRLTEIKLSEQERNERFSFWNLQSGESWKWLQSEHYGTNIQKKRVNQKLFENIRLVRELLTDTNGNYLLSEDEANILILRLIFVRYLIDRNVKMDEEYITGKAIEEKRKSFLDLIQKPRKLNQFFEQLNAKFNGVLFKDITVQLNKDQAAELSWIFSGKPNPTQPGLFDSFYFEIFDFSIIPVEVISGIYESLINPETRDEQSAVYTPAFLVEYILTNTIDSFLTEKKISECRVFDPSCGSGIFLVQSYRRMVDNEKLLHGEKVKKKRLKEIAQKNLFGIDVNRQALKVTCFSIYIAILDYQDPKTILDNFHFPRLLDENFFEANFFDTDHTFNDIIKGQQPHFILGNPPWKSNKDEIHLKWLKDHNKVTGRYEIAQSFLLRSKDFMQPGTMAALIVTSTIFYNISKPTRKFRNEFLTQFCIDRFFDLSPVRRLIFEEKNSPAAIVYYRLSENNAHLSNIIFHQSVKSNIFLKYYKTIIVEKFDQKQIPQLHFIENDWMFKVALYGGTLDFKFLKRLKSIDISIRNIVDNITVFGGAGIKSNRGDDFADFLIGFPIIENSEVREYYTPILKDQKKLKPEDVFYESGRRKELFAGSKVLLKEQARNESDLVISYTDKDCVYKNGIWGIASQDENSLKRLFSYLISDFYTYFVYITSCSWGTSTRPQIRFEDEFLSFPLLETDLTTQKKLVDLVTAYLKPFEEHYSTVLRPEMLPVSHKILAEINNIVNGIYSVTEYENDLIDYVLNVSRYQFQESKQSKFTKRVDHNEIHLTKYAEVFFKELQSVYTEEQITVEVYHLNHFIAMNFVLTEKASLNAKNERMVFISHDSSEKELLQRIAGNLSISKFMSSTDPTKNIYVQKDIKGFEENSFYIIKPNEYKCWHRAMAWYDVAEIKEAIEQAELNHLKNNE